MKKVSNFNDILNEIWYYLFVFLLNPKGKLFPHFGARWSLTRSLKVSRGRQNFKCLLNVTRWINENIQLELQLGWKAHQRVSEFSRTIHEFQRVFLQLIKLTLVICKVKLRTAERLWSSKVGWVENEVVEHFFLWKFVTRGKFSNSFPHKTSINFSSCYYSSCMLQNFLGVCWCTGKTIFMFSFCIKHVFSSFMDFFSSCLFNNFLLLVLCVWDGELACSSHVYFVPLRILKFKRAEKKKLFNYEHKACFVSVHQEFMFHHRVVVGGILRRHERLCSRF